MFSVFKQHYKYFHTLFHPHVVPKNINNVTKTILPNKPLISLTVFYISLENSVKNFHDMIY